MVIPTGLILAYAAYFHYFDPSERWMDIACLACLAGGFLIFAVIKINQLHVGKKKLQWG